MCQSALVEAHAMDAAGSAVADSVTHQLIGESGSTTGGRLSSPKLGREVNGFVIGEVFSKLGINILIIIKYYDILYSKFFVKILSTIIYSNDC